MRNILIVSLISLCTIAFAQDESKTSIAGGAKAIIFEFDGLDNLSADSYEGGIGGKIFFNKNMTNLTNGNSVIVSGKFLKIDEKTRMKVRESFRKGIPKGKIAETFSISVTSVNRIIREKTAAERQEAEPKQKKDDLFKRKIADIERRIEELEEKILQMSRKKKKKCFRF